MIFVTEGAERAGGVYVLLKGGGACKPGAGGRMAPMGGGEMKVPVPGEGSAAATEPIDIGA
jgi:hypothetical protein